MEVDGAGVLTVGKRRNLLHGVVTNWIATGSIIKSNIYGALMTDLWCSTSIKSKDKGLLWLTIQFFIF